MDPVICFFCDASQELAPIVDQKLTVGLEEWRGLVLADNGLSEPSPIDIPLVDNRRKKFVYLLAIPANQTRSGLNDPAQRLFWIVYRTLSCSFYPRRKD